MTRNPLRLLVLLAASFTAIALAVPAQAATPYCGISWGSLAKEGTSSGSGEITDVRSGRHACYDRLVIDLSGYGTAATGYDVRYVDQVTQDGSGQLVPLRGGAKLQIVIKAPAYDPSGELVWNFDNPNEAVDVTGFSTFRQVAYAGSFEGQTTIGLGVRARLPMRVFRLDGPQTGQRIVIDVAHNW
jgi:hypothetical protein